VGDHISHPKMEMSTDTGLSKGMGVYEFNFFNDKTLEKVQVCVDDRVPTKPEDKKDLCFACSEDGMH
jgi:hypothetical protein